jgi:hypothetical protein
MQKKPFCRLICFGFAFPEVHAPQADAQITFLARL